jgi:calcium permeable stress-gated cation channel
MAADEGIARIIDGIAPNSSFARTAIARNVKLLPDLIGEHESAVRKLEKVLAKYLKDPQNLPAARPVCLPSKKDRSYGTYPKGQKVDAIEYLTQRIKELEIEIKEVRQDIDKRNTLTYGFASYSEIHEAHSIAYAARNVKPQGTIIRLAPRPNDIIWDNMPLAASTRNRRRFINNMWVALLTLVWVAPNAMIAIFLVNLSNLGLVWHGFQVQLEANSGFWKFVQGVAAPALTSGIYLLLPIIFRRMATRSGDQTKSGRERHVAAKLYAFFVFNNLVVFSIFSAIWGFVAVVVQKTATGEDGWSAFQNARFGETLLAGLSGVSPFWITWLLQRQLGVAIDLAQLWPLIWGFFVRKLGSPTPRELIELTAPPSIDYATYYTLFLFYATCSLCFAGIQPLVLPAAGIYFLVDVVLRKYLILYVFVTKTESGGMFWRVLFNRFVFGTILANLVSFLVVFVRGNANYMQAYAVAPLPFIMIGFKLYCAKAFDDKIQYYTTRHVQHTGGEDATGIANKADLRDNRLAARFGHPALYKPLITPMVHAKAQNILASVYSGRLTHGREAGSGADATSVSGYSDTYALGNMDAKKPGKVQGSGTSMPGFELVPESRLDFQYYKNRDEFADEHGGGDIFGVNRDIIRPGTPSTVQGFDQSRPGTPVGGMTGRRQFSQATVDNYGGRSQPGTMQYPGQQAYRPASPVVGGYRTQSPQGYQRAQSPGPVQAYRSRSPGPNQPFRTQSPGPAQAYRPQSHGGTRTFSSTASTPGLEEHSRSPYGMPSANDSGTNLVGNAARMPLGTPGSAEGSRDQSPARSPYGAGTGGGALGMYGGGPQGYGGLPQEEMEEQRDPAEYDYFRGSRRNTRGWPGEPGGGQRRS